MDVAAGIKNRAEGSVHIFTVNKQNKENFVRCSLQGFKGGLVD